MTERLAWLATLTPDFSRNPEEGIRIYQQALASGVSGVADNPDVFVNLAGLLMHRKPWDAAEATLHAALTLNPQHVMARYNLGCLLHYQNRSSEAAAAFEHVLSLVPTHVDAMINLANARRDLMQREIAQDWMRKAHRLAPEHHLPVVFGLFESLYAMGSNDATVHAQAVQAAAVYCKGWQEPRSMPLASPWQMGKRALRVGFVSGDFKAHPVGFFLQSWLGFVDSSRASLHAFSMFESNDPVAQKLRTQFETWHSIARLTDHEAQRLIAEQKIDILIDLSGYTDMNRLPLFARRAAPVQISWLGWYATTGVINIDYFITDPLTSPAWTQAYHSERLLYLPATRLCMAEPMYAPAVNPLPALQNKYLTFGSLQALAKITDATLRLWQQVLEKIPTAHLVVCCLQFSDAHKLHIFQERLVTLGLPTDRIKLLPPASYEVYFQRYHGIDIVLDTIPFPGGTTTAEALWMGVPTLTLTGSTLISRQGASLLAAAGLVRWVTQTTEKYVAEAVYWSEHVAELAQLRSGLRTQVRSSPVFDGEKFAQALTHALETVLESPVAA